MKILCAAPAILRFSWELEVILTNLRQFGNFEVILLFSEHDFTVPGYFRKNYPECSVFVFTDNRDDKGYIPSIRPYLWWQYLKTYPEAEHETYLYIDSDIIFRELPDFNKLPATADCWYSSNCSGYIGYDYIMSREQGSEIAVKMAEITGITLGQMAATPGVGAQWVISKPTAAFWERAYADSNAIYNYLQPLPSNVQKWTAEMWAQLFGMTRERISVKVSDELSFCMGTDPMARWNETKILHNAGVTVDRSHELFFKGEYVDKTPFGRDFSHVRRDMVSCKYVEAIQKVIH